MTKEKFDHFWGISFYPKVEKLLANYPNIRFDPGKAAQVYVRYEAIKDQIHDLMMNPDGRIDRHKVGSALIAAILEVLPFSGPEISEATTEKNSGFEYLPNEIWAWHCALSIVLSFSMEEAKRNNDSARRALVKKGFAFPPCSHGAYEVHVLRSLNRSRVVGAFDIFSFSQILFWVEIYSVMFRQSTLLKHPPI
ncbi:MAG: hypothetical protein NXI24_14150 [bacterium]|nr:hypothetical protein [bacterium]